MRNAVLVSVSIALAVIVGLLSFLILLLIAALRVLSKSKSNLVAII